MFGVGTQELVIILVLVLILFGPRKLPEIGRAIGKAMRELKRTTQDFREAIEQEPPEEIRKEVEKKLSENISREKDVKNSESG
ncbi:MAG: twin-arginine translocase TatA/TatE family subunit [bacterium]